jgi:hypothetical protein
MRISACLDLRLLANLYARYFDIAISITCFLAPLECLHGPRRAWNVWTPAGDFRQDIRLCVESATPGLMKVFFAFILIPYLIAVPDFLAVAYFKKRTTDMGG